MFYIAWFGCERLGLSVHCVSQISSMWYVLTCTIPHSSNGNSSALDEAASPMLQQPRSQATRGGIQSYLYNKKITGIVRQRKFKFQKCLVKSKLDKLAILEEYNNLVPFYKISIKSVSLPVPWYFATG